METFYSILRAAVSAGASDIHIKLGAPVAFRIERDLVPVDAPTPTAAWLETVLAHIVPAHLREQLERDHEADFAYSHPEIGRLRVNVFQQRGSFVISMRLLKSTIRDFRELHLPRVLQRIAEAPRGIVIIAGATGSGKSTTLAALIEHINLTARKHIISLEDPIEYLFEDKQSIVEQREVGLDTASFASGLKNVLRQDPDVLVIGEMRDVKSVAAAISAANIGHLVVTTLHTTDAAKSIQRILEFFPSEDRDLSQRQLATTLHAVVCQRLVQATAGGVLPAVEVLINNAALTKLIHNGHFEKIPGAMELGTAEGMQTFDLALHQLVTSGQITQREALLHSPNPEGLKMRFQGVVLNETGRILGSRY